MIREETVVADTTKLLDDGMINPVMGGIVDQKDLAEHLLTQAKKQGASQESS